MTITTVSPETAIPEHFASCTETAIGRRVKEILAAGGPAAAVVFMTEITASTQIERHRGNCSCFALQLTRVEADLAARRRAQRAGYDREAEIEQLIIARDALRQAVAA